MNEAKFNDMDSRLLFAKPRRQTWARKAPSIVRVAALSKGPSQVQDLNLLPRTTPSQFSTETIYSEIAKCLNINVAAYTILQFLGGWSNMLLHNPQNFIVSVFTNGLATVVNAPPLISRIVIPMTLLYLGYELFRQTMAAYQGYLDLGRGANPSSPRGFIKVSIEKFIGGIDVLNPPHVPPMLEPYRGRLSVGKRVGERPIVRGVAPQRQFDQKTSAGTFDKLLQMLKDISMLNDNLEVTTSFLEGHNDALRANFPDRPCPVRDTESEWNHEIAHAHPIDGSLHVILHPEDCRTVIDNGWGELHPLANDAWWWKYGWHNIMDRRRPVPYNLMLIYAPRNLDEFRVVRKIVEAATWFALEKDICGRISQGLLVRTQTGDIVSREDAIQRGKWVDGPGGKLITLEKALDRGLYEHTSCKSAVGPVFKSAERSPAMPPCCS